jgi:hypothetical protein
MGRGLPGAPGAPAQVPAMVDPKSLRRPAAASVLHQSPPSNLPGSHVLDQPMNSGAALLCHPAQVCRDEAAHTLPARLLIWGTDALLCQGPWGYRALHLGTVCLKGPGAEGGNEVVFLLLPFPLQ